MGIPRASSGCSCRASAATPCCSTTSMRALPPEAIRIRQEVALGAGVFADVEVRAGGAAPYFVEVKAGLLACSGSSRASAGSTASPVAATEGAAARGGGRRRRDPRRPRERWNANCATRCAPGLALELWDEATPAAPPRPAVRASPSTPSPRTISSRSATAVDHAKGAHAFGDGFPQRPARGRAAVAPRVLARAPAARVRPGPAPLDPAGGPVPRRRRADGRSLLVLELRARHAGRRGLPSRAHRVRLDDAGTGSSTTAACSTSSRATP